MDDRKQVFVVSTGKWQSMRIERDGDVMAKEQQQPSLGGQFDSWLREGAKDLHNAIVPAFPQSARGVDEPGTPLNPTPQMVTQDLGAVQGPYESMVADYAARPEPEKDKQQER